MALSRAKYKRLPDLYVTGTEVVLKDGSVVWMQVLNPFETDEARHDAQVARSRLVMALQQHGSDEMNFVDTALWQDGIEGARAKLVEAKAGPQIVKVVDELRDDPEWTERLQIMSRTDPDERPLEQVEQDLLSTIQQAYVDEVQRRMAEETAFLTEQFQDADEALLRSEYGKLYIERRGGELAAAEFRTVELWYAARVCEGVLADGLWAHAACEGHAVRVFETKGEVRALPEHLGQLLGDAYESITMSVRDAKDLARLASSSDSSRQPSEPAESTPSTSTETQ